MFSHLPQLIVYLRHPQCLHNVEYDDAIEKGIPNKLSPLTQLGQRQCEITAAYLRTEFGAFDFVASSDFLRTHTIPMQADFDFVSDARLGERNMGIWHELGPKECKKRFPDMEAEMKASGYYHYRAPEGETCIDVEARLENFFKDEQLFPGAKTMLISGHGIAGLCLRKLLTGATEAEWHTWSRLKNASVTVYEREGDGYIPALYNYAPWIGQISDVAGVEA